MGVGVSLKDLANIEHLHLPVDPTPTVPPAWSICLHADTDGHVKQLDANGVTIDLAAAGGGPETDPVAVAALALHEAATTTVHGITNTANLVYTNDSRLHDRQHAVTSTSDHTFPGGTTNFLREDGTWAAPSAGPGADAFPVGSVFISVVSTSPTVLLGYGVWTAFGAGRMLVGIDPLDTAFDTAEETGGTKTHTLTVAEMPAHSHVENSNNATTGPLRGWGAPDTSTNTPTATGYSTADTGGGEAHNNLPPYIVCYFWKRTA